MKPYQKKRYRLGTTDETVVKPVLLYVDDEEENQKVAKLRLKKDYDLLLASSSSEACELIANNAKRIEAILMDIELQGSELDGIRLTKLIRGTLAPSELPEYGRRVPVLDIPIVFVTAYGDRYSEEELLAAGGNQIIRKPVDFLQLTMALTQIHLQHVKNRLAKRISEPAKPLDLDTTLRTGSGKPVLLYVEDEETERNFAKFRLGLEFDLLFAKDAEEACRILISRGPELAAILMDTRLKGSDLDGVQLAQVFLGRSREAILPLYAQKVPVAETPIFFVVTEREKPREKQLVNISGHKVLKKPVDTTELSAALAQV